MIYTKRAFTLFELMVVVMIIGIVYAVVLGRFNPKEHIKIVQLDSLRDILTERHQEGQRLDLILYDGCKKAALFVNNIYQEKMDINLKPRLFEGVQTFKSDPYGHARKIEFIPVVIDDKLQPVCFQYTVYPNGSASNYIVVQKQHYYVFPPYFEDVNVTESMEEALALFTHEKEKKISAYE